MMNGKKEDTRSGELSYINHNQNRTEIGQEQITPKRVRLPKTHLDYWKGRIRRRCYIDGNGARIEIPEWQVRLSAGGHEAWFNLGTAVQFIAAEQARKIYEHLRVNGWAATLARYKPSPLAKLETCTFADFYADIAKRGHFTPRTLRIYITKLRKIVADITKTDSRIKKAERAQRYDYVNGGRARWVKKIDSHKLDVLSQESLAAWRNSYVSKAGADPLRRKAAERSASSMLRAGRSLFGEEVLSLLKVKTIPSPFVGVKVKDPGPVRYQSDVSGDWLLVCADRELRAQKPQVYLALCLCLWTGLRRKEADVLTWAQVDLESGQIHIRRTVHFEPKTEESRRSLDLAPSAISTLKRFKEGCASEFVMTGVSSNPGASYGFYRCDRTWRELIAWLKSKGVTQRNAIHSLRKESGSLVASQFGIEDARRHLGHRDIATTSAHYVDRKRRIEVSFPMSSGLQVLDGGRQATAS